MKILLSIIAIFLICFGIMAFSASKLRKSINEIDTDTIKKEFKHLKMMSWFLLIVVAVAMMTCVFRNAKNKLYCPIRLTNLIFITILFVFVKQMDHGMKISESAPVPISFIDMKFKIIETLIYSVLFINIVLLGTVLFSKKDKLKSMFSSKKYRSR